MESPDLVMASRTKQCAELATDKDLLRRECQCEQSLSWCYKLCTALAHVVLVSQTSLRHRFVRWTEPSVQKVKVLKGSMAQMASEASEGPWRMPKQRFV